MGAEPTARSVVTTASGRLTTVKTTTTTTTTTRVKTAQGDGESPSSVASPSSFGLDYLFGVFRGGSTASEDAPDAPDADAEPRDDDAKADGVHAKVGTVVRRFQDVYDQAEVRMSAAQMVFERAATEATTAQERAAAAKKSGLPGAAQVADAVLKQANMKLERASVDFQEAEKELKRAAAAKRDAEVELAASDKARRARERLFEGKGRKGGYDADVDVEAKKLAAVIKLQRAWRRYAERKRAKHPDAIARTIVRRIFSRESAFAILVAFLVFSGSLFADDAVGVGQKGVGMMEAIRTFSALDHGYLARGVTSGTVMAELTVLRTRHENLLSDVDECEASLDALRRGESDGWGGAMKSPLAGSCSYKLREAEKELARLKKNSEVDSAIAVDKQIRLLRAELTLSRQQFEHQKFKHEEDVAYLTAVHEAENEKLMAHAQANIMDAKHEGARWLRKSQLELEDAQMEVSTLQDRVLVYERELRGDPSSSTNLLKQHDALVKKLKKKHAAAIQALDSDFRAKLSESKAENVKFKNRDIDSLEKLKEKHAIVQRSLEETIKLANEHANAAKDQVCKSKKSSTLTFLVYPLIAAVGLLLGVVANSNHQTVSSTSKSKEPTVEPVVGVPVCKRCEAAEARSKQMQTRCEFAEDASANLRKEIKTLQEDNARVTKRLSQRVVVKTSKLEGSEAREHAEDKHGLEQENIKLTTRVHEAQARALELTEQKEMLTVRVNTIQKKLIEEGGVIKELSDKLVHSEKENFELRQVVEESRADTASAEKRMADLINSLDSTGKERGGLQNELESANKRLKDAAAQLTKSSAAAKQKDEKIETLLSSKEDVEKQLTLVAEDLAIFKERYAAGERTKAQLEAHNADLQAQLRRSKSMHETQITQLQQRLSEIDSDREGLNNEQERLLEEVVSKQEEVDQLMAQVIKLQDSDEALGDELADLIKINESMRERLEMQEELLAQSREKDLVIVEHESNLDALNSRYEKTKSKLKACEISRDEGVTQLRNRDTRIEFLEEELASIRELQGANSARLSDQLKRLGELEMDAGRKKAAKEAAELKLEQSEAAARKTVAHLEEEISNLQNQLASERTAAEISRASGDVNAARLRQETRQLQEKIDALNACESEKAQMSQEIARLEQEMEELRSRLAELLAELSDMKRTGQATSPLEVVQVEEERQTLVYDEAADMLRGLKRVSLFNLLYSVSFAKVRDQRQWNSLTLSALSTAVRPIPTPRKRDAAYYAKKRCARVLVHLATTPAHHNIPRSGWLEHEQGSMSKAVGWHDAEDVWTWATRALAAISRVFQGPNAHQMYQLGGLQTALELMRHAESAVDIQLHGARSISGLISGELAFFGRDAPQIVSGSALETLAVTLRTFPLDVRVVRAAARAVWVCIHLGGQFGQHTFVQQQVYEPLMFAMNCHLGDLKVVESCCGAVLAAASANPDTQQKLADSGVRDVVRDTLQTISEVSFSGAFTDLSDWLFEA